MDDAPPDPAPRPAGVATYRLAPAFAARLVGFGVVVTAVVVLLVAVLAWALSWPAVVVVVVGVVGVLAVLGAATWLRRRYVVRLDDVGYHVRMVRGAGVTRGRWTEVESAAAASPHGIACVVLRRHDGAATSIPVAMLATDRERFADEVRARLERAAI
ncbi:hypothetical protein GCM10023340_03650 [Nocardioides marinquilinus]|uniref:PH domain-containing protein n=1 Tax=Nocardioides marinquilinus TaxID=1210400 RepID=A0ABP9P7F2_9ACTN